MKGKVYLAVDIETTGQYLGVNAMIKVGMVVLELDEESDEKLKILESFSVCLKENDAPREERCMKEFWAPREELLKEITEQAVEPEDAMSQLVIWLTRVETAYNDCLVVLSDNPSYDVAWINYYLAKHTDRPMLYYGLQKNPEEENFTYQYRRIWDTDSAFHGALAATEHKVIEWGLEKALDVQNDKWSNTHDSIEDASNIAANYALFIKKTCASQILTFKKPKTTKADEN